MAIDFSKFKLIKSSKDSPKFYKLKYGSHVLALIDKKVLASICVHWMSSDFLKTLGIHELMRSSGSLNVENKAMQLEKAYTSQRRKFMRNKRIKGYTEKDKEFKHFTIASEIIERNQCNNIDFLKAQVEGLRFTKTFPKPTHLSTRAAEDRLIDYLFKRGGGDVVEINRLPLIPADRSTPLMENHRFTVRWDKLEQDKATLEDAYFIHDCMMARKEGLVTDRVKNYIKKLEEEHGIS